MQGPQLTQVAAEQVNQELKGDLHIKQQFAIINYNASSSVDLNSLRQRFDFDINILPTTFQPRNAALVVSDMDSTLISIECIDEIADFMQLKPQVAEITEAAMRGEIDFETSLRKRVSLLKGLDVSLLDRVYEERLKLNPGAETLINTLKQNQIKFALVSGGFTFFTDKLKERLGLDFSQANKLAIHRGKLTGEIDGNICGAQAKADFLMACCDNLNIEPKQTLTLGDGANDLVMMEPSGLSVAYHAKPKVQASADTSLNFSGLDGVLGLLDIDYQV
jgi:phosphoserine phosphatase